MSEAKNEAIPGLAGLTGSAMCSRCGTKEKIKSSPWCGRCWHIETAPEDGEAPEKLCKESGIQKKYDLLWHAAKAVHDHLWENVGHTADWPLTIKSDSEEEAKKLVDKLNALHLLLNVKDQAP